MNRNGDIMRLYKLLTWLMIIFSCSIYANTAYQNKSLVLNNITEKSDIKQIYQDSDGIIWIANNQGLLKYDGNNEIIYNKENNLLTDNEVTSIIENNKILWVGTSQGLVKINLRNAQINHYYANIEHYGSLKNDYINCLFVNQNHTLFIGTNEGLFIYDEKTNQFIKFFTKIDEQLSIGQKMILSVYQDNKSLYLGTQEGLLVYHYEDKTLQTYNTNNQSIISNSISNILNINNKIVFSTEDMIYEYNTQESLPIALLNKPEPLKIFRFDEYSFILLSKALPHLYSFNNSWNVQRLNDLEPNINYIFKDNQNCIWEVSDKGIKLYQKPMNYLSSLQNENNEPIIGQIDKVAYLDQSIYFLKDDNLFKYNISSKNISRVNHPYKELRITDIKKDKNNNLWIASSNYGLLLMKRNLETIERINNINTDRIESLTTDQNEVIFSSNDQIFIFNQKEKTVKSFSINDNQSDKQQNIIEITSLCRIDHEVWIGTKNGLFCLNTLSSVIQKFYAGKNSISNNSISALQSDHLKNLWIGTANGVLNRYNSAHKEFKYYTINHWISGIMQDAQKNLWISTSKGIIRFDQNQGILKKYFKNANILSDECVIGAIDFDRNQLVVGTTNGILLMNIDKTKNPPIKTTISSFKIFDKDYINDGLINTERDVRLSYKQNFITFEFSGLDYFNQDHLKYAYYLKGLDNKWIEAGNRNFISYNNLKGRDYTLFVKTCDSEGNWSSDKKSFHFKVIPPFWHYTSFKISLILFFLFTVGLTYFVRMSALKNNQIKLEQLVNIKTSELANALEEINIQKKDLEHSYLKLRETQKEIIELEKKNSVLAMAITANHEINQPLMIIKGNVELLEMQFESIEHQHQKYLNRIHQSVERISVILEKFKCIDRVKVKKYTDQSDMIDINQISESTQM